MKILGIIAEYNPMHTGHIFHINEAKKLTGADYVICVMSGNFTQQGNISVINKFDKAKFAVENGIDVIVELPTVFSLSTAENFCHAAITILHSLNCIDTICFGSECNTVEELTEIENNIFANKEIIDNKIKEYLKQGNSYSMSRINAIIDSYTGKYDIKTFFKSNNILGLEYLRSLRVLNSKINVEIVHRNNNFNALDSDEEFMSATGIRRYLKENNIDYIQKYLPTNILKYLLNDNTTNYDSLYNLFRYKVTTDSNILKLIDEVVEGLENRIHNNCINYVTYDKFIEKTVTRRYSEAKIKRIILKTILNIKEDFSCNENDLYCRILAINKDSDNLLSIMNKCSKIPVLTRINDDVISTLSSGRRKLMNIDLKATNVYNILKNDCLNSDYHNKL